MAEGPTAEPPAPVDFEIIKDAWQVIRLADGTQLRLKIVIFDVLKDANVVPTGTMYALRGQILCVPVPAPKQVTTDGEGANG
jgi:hypothetical protein